MYLLWESMKSKISIILILGEAIIIMALGIYIYIKYNNRLHFNINRINKKRLIQKTGTQLKYFYEPKPNSVIKDKNSWLDYKPEYIINSDSLNERFDYSIQKPLVTFRIITLGDSFTYGLLVDTKDNWPEVLEDLLNKKMSCKNIKKFEVINLAMEGYDIQYSAERYEIRGKKYNPDLVLWFIKLTNFLQINERIIPKINQYIQNNQPSKNAPYIAWDMGFLESLGDLGEDQILGLQREYLKQFRENNKTPLFFLTFSDTPSKYKDLLKQTSTNYSNTYWSDRITDVYKTAQLHFQEDWHPNQKGHQIIAQDVFRLLTRNKIIPCQ